MSASILIAVTHLLGVGHLTRAAALARAFAEAGHRVTLVSGGRPAPLVATAGLTFVQAPPVHIRGTAFSALLDEHGGPAGPDLMAARRRTLLDALDESGADVVITELFPFGRRALAEEFDALLTRAAARRPRPVIVASVRDILVAPEKGSRVAQAHRRLADRYDAVLVHGDPAVTPLEASWPLEEALRPLLHYTGYVADGRAADPSPLAVGEILVSGGGSAASLPLLRAARGAADILPGRSWRILVGNGVDEGDFRDLASGAPGNATIERARADFPALLASAAVSVSQAGYNTVVDLVRSGARAVLVPFEAGRETEQRLRADSLAARGLAEVLPEAALSAATLAQAVERALGAAQPTPGAFAADGAARSVAVVETLATISPTQRAWRRFDTALRRIESAGVPVDLWWRDDDATAASPALDRLLALARRHQAPLALAVVPASLDPSLSARLADESDVAILVHGLAHRNHAPASEKKSEFGNHRPPEVVVRDAAEGLRLTRATFGERASPVFVPPWNRISDEVAAVLPSLGFHGLSTFAGARPRPDVSGLLQIDMHVDPMDWRGSRSLADLDGLLDSLAGHLTETALGTRRGPVGLLTHHLVHDEKVWTFLDELMERLARCETLRFRSAETLFSVDQRAGKAERRGVR
jgi:predicted glycosyltransferase